MRTIRVFISSPGDVPQERKHVLDVLDMLQYDPFLRGKVVFEVVAWDKPGADTPLLATMTPQEAINEGLAKPSECDIVIVILWSRLGTPLPPDYEKPVRYQFPDPGEKLDTARYFSGTEWEFVDAFEGEIEDGLPLLVVYKNETSPTLDMKDSKRAEKLIQYDRVAAFFANFSHPDGSIKQGYNSYTDPAEFKEKITANLRSLISRLLEGTSRRKRSDGETTPAPLWEKSPFPGLRAFTPSDAPIFFGRTRETDALIEKVKQQPLVAVVGASGSGKSSLVGAGLLPALKRHVIPGSADWSVVNFTPGDAPFQRLAEALLNQVPALAGDPAAFVRRSAELADTLHTTPDALARTLTHALKEAPAWVKVLLFVDQFEELLTLTPEAQRRPFADLLVQPCERLGVVLTLRADFYHRAVEIPTLAERLREGSFPLAKPSAIALHEMIVKPAERAGLVFEAGLPEHIVKETGDDAGALALMAYTLDELYHACKNRQQITFEDYKAVGGVQGAIGQRAEATFARLSGDKDLLLERVFHELVSVDERGVATRQRLTYDPAEVSPDEAALMAAFTQARLLVQDEVPDTPLVTLEVAHEALLRNWGRLAVWIEQRQGDLFLLAQLRRAVAQWAASGRKREYLWLGERNRDVQAMLTRLHPRLSGDEQTFARPEFDHLVDELKENTTTHFRREEISLRIADLGDTRPGVGLRPDGLPDIVWCYVAGGYMAASKANALKKSEDVPAFYIAKYPITYVQFKAFYEAEDGYQNNTWWQGLSDQRQDWKQNRPIPNYPADNVAWVDAVALTRWLTHRWRGETVGDWIIGQNAEIRLPTEAAWVMAATAGQPDQPFPWGQEVRPYAVNIQGAALGLTVTVGMYPAGMATCGAEDLLGNVWEWMLNDYWSRVVDFESTETKAQRGASFIDNNIYAGSRLGVNPSLGGNLDGVRVVCVSSRP